MGMKEALELIEKMLEEEEEKLDTGMGEGFGKTEVLEFIDSFLVEKGGDEVIVNWDGRTPRDLLKLIKRDLEK